MANSGWSWHLFAAPAIWVARIRGKPVIINYRGGEADSFFNKSFSWIKPSLSKADAIVVPSGFLEAGVSKARLLDESGAQHHRLSRFKAGMRTSPTAD